MALVLLVAGGLPTAGWPAGSALPTASAAGNAASVAGVAAGGPDRMRPAARSSPVWLRIPALGLAASVGSLGLNPDGTVEVPTNPDQAGWYRLGPSPGQIGSAVILGHVDSKTGPAVFYRLRLLRPGNGIAVTLNDGSVVRFRVDRVVTYPNAKFPAGEVYGSHGYAALQLVTCGGRYDHRARSYTANVVVYTVLVSITGTGHKRSRR